MTKKDFSTQKLPSKTFFEDGIGSEKMGLVQLLRMMQLKVI